CLPYVAVAGIGVRDIFAMHHGKNQGFGSYYSTPSYLLSETQVIFYYLRLAFWPIPLCIDYFDWLPPDFRTPAQSLWTMRPWAAGIAVLGLAGAWGLLKRHWLGFVGAAFFLILAPTSSFMPIRDLVMEHRMYLPLACVVVPVVVGVWWALDFVERVEP